MKRKMADRAIALCLVAALGGCNALGGDGPVVRGAPAVAGQNGVAPLILPLDAHTLAADASLALGAPSLAQVIGDGAGVSNRVAPGDELSISLYEAPPAVLFGAVSTGNTAEGGSSVQSTRGMALSNQTVDREGRVAVPFAGNVPAAGLTTDQIQRAIVGRLSGKANHPQALVRIVRKTSEEVSIVGDVPQVGRFPLSPKGERLLDVIASAGGTKQPANKMSVKVVRDGRSATIPFDTLLATPSENIRLQAGDIVAMIYQANQFVAIGAVTKPAEYEFESTGITMMQALGRIGGLRQDRANIHGLFLFRYEPVAALPAELQARAPIAANGQVPVIYKADFAQPATMFAMRDFAVRNGDVIYVSTALGADLQRLVGAVSSGIFSIAGLKNL